ncbi:MAG: hypothetical protein HYU36_09990 [Planctomycetes bacterium]|nr:hypothetical protein [Planctomycetota bacterium]
MSFLGKVLVILNLLLAVIYAGISAVLYTQRVDYKAQISALEQQRQKFIDFMNKQEYKSTASVGSIEQRNEIPDYITVVRNVGSELKNLLEKHEIEVNKLKDQGKFLESKISDLENKLKDEESKRQISDQKLGESELERKKLLTDYQNLNARMDELREARDAAEKELKDFRGKHDTLYTQHLQLTTKAARLDEEVKEAELASKQAQTRIERLETELKFIHERFPETITGGGTRPEGGEGPIIRGRVLAVKPDLKLVIIDKGGPDKVQPGMRFIVYRADQFVGHIEVEKVIGEYSSAKITNAKISIQQGDQIANRLQ